MQDVRELLRRRQAGQSARQIARETGLDRKTVGRYLEQAAVVRVTAEVAVTDGLAGAVGREVQARPLPTPRCTARGSRAALDGSEGLSTRESTVGAVADPVRPTPGIDGVIVQGEHVLDHEKRERGSRARHFASFSMALPRFFLMCALAFASVRLCRGRMFRL